MDRVTASTSSAPAFHIATETAEQEEHPSVGSWAQPSPAAVAEEA